MRLRSLLPVVVALVVAAGWFGLLAPGPVWAEDGTAEDAIVELDRARALVDESARLYAAGQGEDAYRAARNGYLDHFEFVEIPLRVRDEALTLELEEDFARLRTSIQAGAPADEVETIAAEVQRGLDTVERTLSSPGLAAPLLAAISAFTILFREGLEAVLILAAVLGYLEASRNTAYRGAVLRGVGGALLATLVAFAVITAVLRLAPVGREVIEAATALLAVGVLFYVSFWLVSRLDQRRWMEFVRAKVWAAAATGSAVALFGVGFTTVFREGLETVLFYQALLAFAEGLEVFVLVGTLLAAGVLAVVGWAILVAGRRIPVRRFLQAAVVLIMALSVAFLGNAVRALQEAALVPVTFLEAVPRLPIFLADLTGWHPTSQTIIAQIAFASVYVTGAAWVMVVAPRRARRVTAAAEVSASPGRDPGR